MISGQKSALLPVLHWKIHAKNGCSLIFATLTVLVETPGNRASFVVELFSKKVTGGALMLSMNISNRL